MVISVPGQYYVLNIEDNPSRETLRQLLNDLNENDIVEVRNQFGEQYHITQFFFEYNLDFRYLNLPIGEDMFETISKMPYDFIMPVFDSDGNCISILKKVWSYYEHPYCYEGELDLTFLNRYDWICLFKPNEYSVELYKQALPLWKGKKVFLIGSEWEFYIDILPSYYSPEIKILPELTPAVLLDARQADRKVLYINEFLPKNEDISRYKDGIMSYDEVMTLTFMFSNAAHPGVKHPDKKFFIIDGFYRLEGIFAIWNKAFCAARYALSKGYLPIFEILTSDANMYSDFPGDDIWNKFFLQPGGYTLEEVHQSSYLTYSPNMNLLTIMRHILNEESAGFELQWPDGIFNDRVKKYISERQHRFLPHPDRTLGVLIRGTDYIHNPLPNHPKHADMDMVIKKINEVESEWDFDYIFLSTEDQNICLRMQEHYGERLRFTDQERFTLKPGQLLIDLHQEKVTGDGFRLGAEYICTLNLLSQCSCFIASGRCGGTSETLRENGGRYRHMYIFNH